MIKQTENSTHLTSEELQEFKNIYQEYQTAVFNLGLLSLDLENLSKEKTRLSDLVYEVNEKRLEIGLTCLYGIGISSARKILDKAKIPHGKKSKDLTPDEENIIRKIIEEQKIEGNLKREVAGNIKRLKDIKCYRGTRHLKGLPSRGQRTKTNSRTRRGNMRKTMGTGRKVADKK